MTDELKREAYEWITENYGDGNEVWCDPVAIKYDFDALRARVKLLEEALEKIIAEHEKDMIGDRDDWMCCADNMKMYAEEALEGK